MAKNILILLISCTLLFAVWVYKYPTTSQRYLTNIMSFLAPSDQEKPARLIPDSPAITTRTVTEEEKQFFSNFNSRPFKEIASSLTTEKLTLRDEHNNTVLHHAINHHDPDTAYQLASLLLENAVDINSLNNYHQNALHIAANKNRYQLIPLLLRHGINYRQRDYLNKRALDYAGQRGYRRVADILHRLDYNSPRSYSPDTTATP